MEPTFKNGDKILATYIFYLFKSPQVNDIVVFKDKENIIFVKRIIDVKNNRYIVLGDNKKDSLDSRNFGEIQRDQILGKFIYKL